MSKEEETRDDFFEYLLALDLVTRDSKFSPHADFDLTEEDIKNAVKEGVIEGIKEFLSEKI